MTPVPAPVTRWRWLALLLVLLGLAGYTGLTTGFEPGRDSMPLIVGGRFLLDGISPYSTVAQETIRELFVAPGRHVCESCGQIGLVYPAPAIVLGLPFAALPLDLFFTLNLWLLLMAAIYLAGLRVAGVPVVFALAYVPALIAVNANNPVLLTTGLLLLAPLFAARQHWWALALVLVLPVAIKPNATMFLAAFLALPALRAGWRGIMPFAVVGAVLWGVSGVLMPGWIPAWLDQMRLYRAVEGRHLTNYWYVLPLAAYLAYRGRHLTAVTLAQVVLLPVMSLPYSFVTLTLAYVELPTGWWKPALFSWAWPIIGIAVAGTGLHPGKTATLLTLILPIALVHLYSLHRTPHATHPEPQPQQQ